MRKLISVVTRASAAMAALSITLSACGEQEQPGTPIAMNEEQLMTRLLEAQPGDVIEIPEGKYNFDRSLSLTVDNVTLRGAGMDKTTLSFAGQIAGAEGLLVTASDFIVEDLAIEDTKGDGLKVNDGENIIIRRVRVEWTNGPSTENGAYGLYPVQTKNLLVEDSVAIGASDAGIYVGQSENVVVRNNTAERNVAGIEIENTRFADVYRNVATQNTGGILVFNMPDLPVTGSHVRIFDNEIHDNNTDNFGHEGTAVANVPAGSGIIINSHDLIEVFENEIRDHKTANILISSVMSTDYADREASDVFDPYPNQIAIRTNEFSGGGNDPDLQELAVLKEALFGPQGKLPDIVWDGFAEGDAATAQICVDDDQVQVLNFDGPNGSAAPRVEREPFACELEPLMPVQLALVP